MHRCRSGGPCRYLEHIRQTLRKFCRHLWKKVSTKKMRYCQNLLTTFWASSFQNLDCFHFSWHIIWLVCRGVTIFFLTQISRSGKPCRYVEHMRKVHRKVSRGLWKKTFNLKNAKETQNVVQKFWQNLIFLVETFFFQRSLENFLSVWRTCSRYL